MGIAEERIAKGQCPNDGKEAAPYRLCYDCRQTLRIQRVLRRGERLGIVKRVNNKGSFSHEALWALGPKHGDPAAEKQFAKWSTPFNLSDDDDKRARPRLRGSAVDVGATLIEIMTRIGRPCTEQELAEAWGRLRSKRTDPLASDLAAIIRAEDKRKRRARKLAEIEARHSPIIPMR